MAKRKAVTKKKKNVIKADVLLANKENKEEIQSFITAAGGAVEPGGRRT